MSTEHGSGVSNAGGGSLPRLGDERLAGSDEAQLPGVRRGEGRLPRREHHASVRGLDRDLAWLLQLRRELLGYSRVTAGDCTAYAAAGGVLAQTVDLNGNLDDQIAVLEVAGPPRRSLLLSFGGLLGYLGVNDAGVAVGLNLVLGGTWRPGVPPYLAIRHVLDTAESVDHAVECVGRAATIRAAWSCTRRGGTATVVGFGAATDQLTLNALEIPHFARTLQGCMYGSSDPAADVPELLKLYRDGELDLSSLVSRTIGLEDVGGALTDLHSGRGARSLVQF